MAVGLISDYLGGGVDGLKIAIMCSSIGGICAGLCFLRGSRYYSEDLKRVKDMETVCRMNHVHTGGGVKNENRLKHG